MEKKYFYFCHTTVTEIILAKLAKSLLPAEEFHIWEKKSVTAIFKIKREKKKSEQIDKYVAITTVKVIYIKFILWKATFIKQIKRVVNCPKILYLMRFRTIQDSLKENQKEKYLELLISKI